MDIRKFIRSALIESINEAAGHDLGDDRLTAPIVEFLIGKYAKKAPSGSGLGISGRLPWTFKKLPARTYGRFVCGGKGEMLQLNDTKLTGLLKQQVKTILHEIQHWNQLVDCWEHDFLDIERGKLWSPMTKLGTPPSARNLCVRKFSSMTDDNHATYGYWESPHEVDARRFSDENFAEAWEGIRYLASGKIQVEDIDEAWEDILDELSEYDVVTRKMIGEELQDYNMNSPENIDRAIKELEELGVTVS